VIVEYDTDMVTVSVDVFKNWDRVFLGHYHGAQKLNDQVEYVGSPLELSFGEAFEPKHIAILDLDTLETEYIANTFSPKHLILSPKDIDDTNLNRNFVRIQMEGDKESEVFDLTKKVTSQYKVASLDFATADVERKTRDISMVEDAKAILRDENEMLDTYIKSVGTAGLDEPTLKSTGQKIVDEARRRSTA
jgi:DNA repair exonuclease SbcCD nuclease subunit